MARKLSHTIAGALLLAGAVYAFGPAGARPPRAEGKAAVPPLDAGAASPIELEGTRIKARRADGALASLDDLVGAVLVGRIDGGIRNAFRIDDVEVDPADPSGETVLYALSVQDRATGAWRGACAPDARGVARGFPLAGAWTEAGEHVRTPGRFELTCTSGALGKCVRMGYKPWQGDAMWDRHQACVRMVRADYCGDGVGHTRNGTTIDVYDTVGIQAADPGAALAFEAAWGKDGAVCVRRTRLPDVTTLEEIVSTCPARLAAQSGAACSDDAARRDPRALLFNKS